MCDLSLALARVRLAEDVSVTMTLQRPVRAITACEDLGAVGEFDERPMNCLSKDDGFCKLRRPLASHGIACHSELQWHPPAPLESGNTKTDEKKILHPPFKK